MPAGNSTPPTVTSAVVSFSVMAERRQPAQPLVHGGADQAAGSAAARAAWSGRVNSPCRLLAAPCAGSWKPPTIMTPMSPMISSMSRMLPVGHAVVQQVRQRAVVGVRGERPDPALQVGRDLGLDRPAGRGDLAAAAEVGQVGGVGVEPAGQGGVVHVAEPEHVADRAQADPLEDVGVGVGRARCRAPASMYLAAVVRRALSRIWPTARGRYLGFSAARCARWSGPDRLITFGLP